MTGYSKVFIDTAPFIYFLDDDASFGQKMKGIFSEILTNGIECISSVVTCEEYLVHPYRTGNREKEEVFFDFVSDFGIPLKEITPDIARHAAKIRADFSTFKPMDALQLATAVECGCDLFLTNDKQLKQFTGIRCILVNDWT